MYNNRDFLIIFYRDFQFLRQLETILEDKLFSAFCFKLIFEKYHKFNIS